MIAPPALFSFLAAYKKVKEVTPPSAQRHFTTDFISCWKGPAISVALEVRASKISKILPSEAEFQLRGCHRGIYLRIRRRLSMHLPWDFAGARLADGVAGMGRKPENKQRELL
jgi:hypothetical protein